MSSADAHEAAVEAMAGAMFDAVYGGSSGMDEMLESICRDNARIALAALVRSEAVRAALVEALIVAVCVHSDGRPFCIDCDIDAILAALAPEAT